MTAACKRGQLEIVQKLVKCIPAPTSVEDSTEVGRSLSKCKGSEQNSKQMLTWAIVSADRSYFETTLFIWDHFGRSDDLFDVSNTLERRKLAYQWAKDDLVRALKGDLGIVSVY